MNDKEFKALLKQLEMTDADQFQAVCAKLAKIAIHVHTSSDGRDAAWLNAAHRLEQAEGCVGLRSGN